VATVAIQHPDGRVEQKALGDGSYLIGRGTGDIPLADQDVSAHHARLDVRGGRIFVTDLGSTNGTLAGDGRRVTPGQELALGASIRLGRSSITVLNGAHVAGGTRAFTATPSVRAEPARPQGSASVASGPSRTELTVLGKRVVVDSGVVADGSTKTIERSSTRTVNGMTTTNESRSVRQTITFLGGGASHAWDYDLNVKKGHRVSVMSDGHGSVVRVVNHSTNYYNRTNILTRGFFRRFGRFVLHFRGRRALFHHVPQHRARVRDLERRFLAA
jgi:pSer/pThr/pTyr-binding forkhead associated (FHA) protein